MTHGPIYTDKRALETILRWCDRGGEEPEGMCLHEIEQICRKQLGLQALVLAKNISPSDPAREAEAGAEDRAGKQTPDSDLAALRIERDELVNLLVEWQDALSLIAYWNGSWESKGYFETVGRYWDAHRKLTGEGNPTGQGQEGRCEVTLGKLIRELQKLEKKVGPRTTVSIDKPTFNDGNDTWNICGVEMVKSVYVNTVDGDGFTVVNKDGTERGKTEVVLMGEFYG